MNFPVEHENASLLSRREMLQQSCLAGTAIGLLGTPAFAQADASRPTIKVGQIGTSHAHANKIEVYRESPDYEIVGVVEPNTELRTKAEASPLYKGLPFVSEEELLAMPGLQAVLVETEIRDLLATAERCVRAGKHVHIDKPAGASLPQLDRVLDLARQQKLFVQVGYMYRFNPGVVLLHRLLKEGWLGEIFEVHAVMSKVIDPGPRLEMAEFSGGTLFELGCHLIDLVVGLLGKPQAVTSVLRHSSSIEDGFMDNCQAMLTYPKAIATIVSTGTEVDGFQRRHLVVCGTKGTIHIQPLDDPSAELTLAQAAGEFKKGKQTIRFPKFRRYVADAAEMVQAIRGELPFERCYERERLVQETVLQASQMLNAPHEKPS